MGVLPAGIAATVLPGVDVALLGILPIAGALFLGAPASATLVLGQLIWATALAAGVLAHLARRRPA